MKRARSLWPTEAAPFADVITGRANTEHTCSPSLQALEESVGWSPHSVAECPGPLTLEDLCSRSWELEREEWRNHGWNGTDDPPPATVLAPIRARVAAWGAEYERQFTARAHFADFATRVQESARVASRIIDERAGRSVAHYQPQYRTPSEASDARQPSIVRH